MVLWWGKGKRPTLRLLPKLFWEVRPARMIGHPKEDLHYAQNRGKKNRGRTRKKNRVERKSERKEK